MTDAEQLKVAEEKVRIAKELCDYKNNARRETWTCILGDVSLCWRSDAETKKKEYIAHRTTKHEHYIGCGGPELVRSECPVEAIYLARQKLAAEREAAMTPNEQRYRKALGDIVETLKKREWCVNGLTRQSLDIARKALEDS